MVARHGGGRRRGLGRDPASKPFSTRLLSFADTRFPSADREIRRGSALCYGGRILASAHVQSHVS
jgi:hypothetical protein